MSTTIQLSDNQKKILSLAATRTDGAIEPFPTPIKGGAVQAVISSLKNKGVIYFKNNIPVISDAGLEAIGLKPLGFSESVAATTPRSRTPKANTHENMETEKTKPLSKKDILLTLIQHGKGAPLEQLCKATGWQAHSVRGAISQLKAKGHPIESQKVQGNRVYCLESEQEESIKS